MTLLILVMPPTLKRKPKSKQITKKIIKIWNHPEMPLSSQDAAHASRHLWLCS